MRHKVDHSRFGHIGACGPSGVDSHQLQTQLVRISEGIHDHPESSQGPPNTQNLWGICTLGVDILKSAYSNGHNEANSANRTGKHLQECAFAKSSERKPQTKGRHDDFFKVKVQVTQKRRPFGRGFQS